LFGVVQVRKTETFTLLCSFFFFTRYKSLPETMCIDLEYVIDATKWLLCHSAVLPNSKVSIYTISKGTEIAFWVSSIVDLYDSVFVVGAEAFVTDPSFRFGGKLIPKFECLLLDAIKSDENGHINMLPCFEFDADKSAASILPTNRLLGVKKVAFIAGTGFECVLVVFFVLKFRCF
jgi:hypothetical protein